MNGSNRNEGKMEFRLDILIKKEDDYYSAHCLQFDLVETDDTIEGVQKAILDVCAAHIRFALENDNMKYLFHPAPSEVWNELYALAKKPHVCVTAQKTLEIITDTKEDWETSPPSWIVQEILCDERAAKIT